jgi:hypothetical protein
MAYKINRVVVGNVVMFVCVLIKSIYWPGKYSDFFIRLSVIFITMNLASMFSFVKVTAQKMTVFPMSRFIPLPYSFTVDRFVSVKVEERWWLWRVRINLANGQAISLLSLRNQKRAEEYAADIQAQWALVHNREI